MHVENFDPFSLVYESYREKEVRVSYHANVKRSIHSVVPAEIPQTMMLNKVSIVLCLHVLLFGREVEGEGLRSASHTTEAKSTAKVFCPGQVIDGDPYGVYTFPETEATEDGIEVKLKCELGFRDDGLESFYGGQALTREEKERESGVTRKCVLGMSLDGSSAIGKWDPAKITYCKESGWERVLQLFNDAVFQAHPNTFLNIVPLTREVLRYAVDDHDVAVELIHGIDLLLRNPELGPDAVGAEREIVLAVVGEYTKELDKYLRPGFKSLVRVEGIVVETAKFPGLGTFNDGNLGLYGDLGLVPYVTSFSAFESTEIRVGISAEALHMSMNNVSKDPQLTITAYSEDVINGVKNEESTTSITTNRLFSMFNETIPEDCLSNDDSLCSQPKKPWGLLTIELDGVIQDLHEPIEFTITKATLEDGYGMKCAYWNDDAQIWSIEGLESIPVPNGVKCKSTHLTAFSALIEPLPLPFPGAEYAPINNSVHSYILSILSSIGSVCSIVGLSFTLLTYGLFRCLRRDRSNRILINLSASLLLMHIMSVSGSKSLWDGQCLVPAASLHYLVLTSIAWMMVEAVHMFELLISVFVRPENHFLIKRIILAWGIPLIIVGVCVVLKPQVYTVGRADLCLMSAHENIVLYYLAYIGPICIMLLVNAVIFGRIFRVLYQQTKRTKVAVDKAGAPPRYQFVKISPSQIKGATTVMILLGIGWIIGLLAMGPFEVLFRYMYCVCNAGQGLFIFIFRVVLNPQASKQWKKVILGLSADSSLDTSVTTSTSTSTGFGKGKHRKSMISPTFISASNSVENSLTPSDPLSAKLASTLASILRSEDMRAAAAAASSGSAVENNMQ